MAAGEVERMGRCAREAWEHAVEVNGRAARSRPGVTTGHLLLGVLKHTDCAGGLILAKMGLDLKHAYSTTEFALFYGRRRDSSEELTVEWGGTAHSPAAKKVLDFALEEANLFSPTYPIGTEHLVLGLLRMSDGMGCRLLQWFGIEEQRARATRDELWELLRTTE
jgi:ATP-dependent Clp protease ATP-binding subunit ClpC